jgi:hypothetical protein
MPHALRRSLTVLVLLTLLSGPRALAGPTEDELALVRASTPVLTTSHFRFFGTEDVHGTLSRLAEGAEPKFSLMCNRLRVCDKLGAPIDVWVAEDAFTFAEAFPEPSPMSEWAAGVTFLDAQRIVLRAHGTAVFTLQETFDHELAHVLTHVFSREGHAHGGGLTHWPRWFAEGLAIWLSGEALGERLDQALRAAGTGSLLEPEAVVGAFPIDGSGVSTAYAQAALAVRWLIRERGGEAVLSTLERLAGAPDFDAAFEASFGVTPAESVERGSESVDTGASFFYLFWDGQLIWGLATVLFLLAAWWRLRERRAQMAALGAVEAAAVSAEDAALAAAWQDAEHEAEAPRRTELQA